MQSDLSIKYPIGSTPAIHYLPYLIFISYIVSLIGAITTVELLHRRVAVSGWRNLVQLAACSVSFGLVSIWCMHFVGNRAIVLGDGEDQIQLYYSATYTTVSAILPIIVIFIGLLVADTFYKGSKGSVTRYISLILCGLCTGASVTEMHYLGNYGTTNYVLKPDLAYIMGAATIAVIACMTSFGLFFHWTGRWVNNTWRRMTVACFLAVAVSGMHWTAAAGTSYKIQGYHNGPGNARNVNLIIAVCLSLAACGVCFALGFLKQRENRKLRDRAQQVVLAVATFDSQGRVLVNQGGLLPCQTITRRFHQRTFDEDFNIAHPVFQWIFRVSRHWNGIVDLIPSMRDHLLATGDLQPNTPIMSGSRSSMGFEDNTNYSATFRELFCVTAHDIARSLETRLQDLGNLYEDVLTTGTLLNKTLWTTNHGNKAILAADIATSSGDIETGLANPILFGRGQMLVLTKKIGNEEANRLQDIGYRFASIDQVGDTLARSFQIPRLDLDALMSKLERSSQREAWAPLNGTFLAAFLLQPSPVIKGLNVIVPTANPDRLPMVQLAPHELHPNHARLLSQFNGLTLDECMNRISQRSRTGSNDDIWLEKFRSRIYELYQDVSEQSLRQAMFSSQPLKAMHGITGQNDLSEATVFAFCGIKEVNNQTLQNQDLQYVPLSFFRTQQRTYPGCPDHAILAHENHKEFATIQTFRAEAISPTSPKSSKWSLWPFATKSDASSVITVQPDSSSEKGLVPIVRQMSSNNVSYPFGGIMVSQDVTIHDRKETHNMELSDMGVRAEAGIGDQERQTMADRLMAITTSFREPHNKTLMKEHSHVRA
ncbi:hypothetical protein BU24DRAFT_483539 [Aaosphaeria arxii CBS 175.79]|uniref:MHYT domain-containing protein n=1 Tax=Aaosphaeria arxii CBS 175.79 TaxID=1450172 RepID=A0A6A5XLP0_9PLEO|nr:uncharacterized protein BU24DRAFT_483539 [Aaosphaeria arxii CBS 175.79]KAF2013741.1 hypothetical protein BU24DRAFT_483539 [Aaosphaeria arxii CBS 175.79]